VDTAHGTLYARRNTEGIMITSGWLVCDFCEGRGVVPFGSFTIKCPECEGTGEPRPGTYEVDSEDDLFDHEWEAEMEAFDGRG
jgi:DnaJ-class molecular chaperone